MSAIGIIHGIVNWTVVGFLIIVPLSAFVRLVIAAFSPHVRIAIRQHPMRNSAWFLGGLLSFCLLALALFHGQSERTAYMRQKRYMLKIAAEDFAKYGFVTNVWSSGARFARCNNVVTVGGTQYECYAEVAGGQFDEEGTLAVTTNQIFIWLGSNQAPKIIEAGYTSSLLHF